MSVSDAYTTPQEYRALIGKDDTSDDLELATDLRATARYIDRKLGRFFTSESATSRDYLTTFSGVVNPEAENPFRTARGARQLDIDDLVSLTSCLVDLDGDGTPETTYTSGTDFQLWPLNAARGPEPRPYVALVVPPWPQSQLPFPPYRLVRITGTWGWPAVPPAINRANAHLTAILRMEGPRSSRSISADGEILEANPQAQSIVRELMGTYARVSW